MHPRVLQTLTSSGLSYQVRRHADCPNPIQSPQDFATCLGYELARITKTIFCRSALRDKYALLVLPMTKKADFKLAAHLMGCARVEIADRNELQSLLQYPPNGVCPLGCGDFQVFIEESLLTLPTILIGSGEIGIEIEMAPSDVAKICSARVQSLVMQ